MRNPFSADSRSHAAISRWISKDHPESGRHHCEIYGEVYYTPTIWVSDAMKCAQGRGLILAALIDRSADFEGELIHVRGLWVCRLKRESITVQRQGHTALEALINTFTVLDPK